MTNIPSGYSLHIKSWENDADCYKTQVFNGLSKVDVKFLLSLAKLFRSMNNHSNRGLAGGSWHYDGGFGQWALDVADAYDAVVAKFQTKGVTPELLETWTVSRPVAEDPDDPDVDELFDAYNDTISELVGYPEDEMYQSDGYIRVFDSFTVYKYDTEATDVSKEFK